jgi:hypothetical protein
LYTPPRVRQDRFGAEYAPASDRDCGMKRLKFTCWKDGNFHLGFLNDYPDYQTQALSKEELVGNLKSLLADLESGGVPYIHSEAQQ